MRPTTRLGLCALIFLSFRVSAHTDTHAESSDDIPLWELGVGTGLIVAPDYPGSDRTSTWVLPFPWAMYRGEILHSDRRGGARALLFRSASWEFNVSAGGGLPSSSRDNEIRRGMPDLEWVGEIGPRLMIDLWGDEHAGGTRQLRLGLPFRAALSTNGRRLTDRGFRVAPELMYEHLRLLGSRFDGFMHLTFDFLDRRFANYFYGVEPQYATTSRPAYVARGGYLQSELTAGFMVPLNGNHLRFFLFASAQYLDGSVNQNSPLFRTRWNHSASAVLIWVFAESERKVRTN